MSQRTTASDLKYLDELVHRPQFLVFIESAIPVILATVSVFGNILVCCAVIKFKHLRTVSNMLVFNLAISDILMAITCMPIASIVLWEAKWIGNYQGCQANGFLMLSFGNLSLMNLTAIAITRFLLVCKPHIYSDEFTWRKSLLIILITWILPPTATIPPLLGWGSYQFFPGKGFCLTPFQDSISYTVYLEVLFIGSPLIAIHICYFLVFREVKRHNKMLTTDLVCIICCFALIQVERSLFRVSGVELRRQLS